MSPLNLQYPTCPIRNVLSRFSDKWSLLVLATLSGEEKMRYKDLLASIPDISQKMLSVTLKHLDQNHLVHRKAYAEIPPRVEYSLTDVSKSFLPILQMMIDWSTEHFEEVAR